MAHSSCQSWCNWVRFVGLLAHTCFFSSAHTFSIGLRSGLRDGHSNTLTLLSLSHFATTLEVRLGSLSIWKTHLRPSFNFLTSWDVASIYPYNCPPSWCHLFCEVHQSTLLQSNPTTWCCHPRSSRLGWCSSACKPPPFSSKHNDGHYGQTVLFFSSDQRTFLQKVRSLSPCAVANRSLAFLRRFWSSGFFLAERHFRGCRYRTQYFCTCFLQNLHKVLRCCSGIDLHFSH